MTNGRHSSQAEIIVYLGLGSNVGDRETNLREAIARIEMLGLEVAQRSSIYETEPAGYKDQPWFLNQVIEAHAAPEVTFTDDAEMAAPLRAASDEELELVAMFRVCDLLQALLNIEREMGRERTIPDGPRAIDIDILICGDMEGFFAKTRNDPANSGSAVACPPFLTLPHPRMHLRRFVLEPLCEIAPELVHPVLKKTCRELLAEVKDSSVVGLYEGRD